MPETWPILLRDRELVLRPLYRADRRTYTSLRTRNAAWLAPWDATDPHADRPRPSYAQMIRWMSRSARTGASLPLAITVDRRLAGQITAGPIQWGPLSSTAIGYWIDERLAGRGYTPRALALLIDHCLTEMGMHRVELAIRPENTASLRVARKLHLRDEGLRRSCIHVDGAWRDHRIFAIVAEEAPGRHGGGLLDRLHRENGVPDRR